MSLLLIGILGYVLVQILIVFYVARGGMCWNNYAHHGLRPSPLIPAGARQNHVRPFAGEKVHWTFSCFRLTSPFRGRGGVGENLC